MKTPPKGPGRRVTVWAKRSKQKLRHLPQYIIGGVLNLFSRRLKLHPLALPLVRRAMELGNPTGSIWPSETVPMLSRLLASGFWNFSFFQFHRYFYFPYWAHRQYNPAEPSFIPRSHNLLSINQTQRNWVSISFPGKIHEICVDMAGAIMYDFNSATIEMAILEHGKIIRPHDNADELQIEVPSSDRMAIHWKGRSLYVTACENGLHLSAKGTKSLILSIRPFNMEGPALLYKLNYDIDKGELSGDVAIRLRDKPQTWQLSTLEHGDALGQMATLFKNRDKPNKKQGRLSILPIKVNKSRQSVKDGAGLATASFYFNAADDINWFIKDLKKTHLPPELVQGISRNEKGHYEASQIYEKWFGNLLELNLPEPYGSWFNYSKRHIQTLWDFDSITPGSFTYHHFWVRDAVVMLNAFLLLGAEKAVKPVLQGFASMVKSNGLFRSQAGEWDANGQALWIFARYAKVTGDTSLIIQQRKTIRRMIQWVARSIKKHGGVLPPGFSAEHLGVADWYLWDNFWALGGLKEMASFQQLLHIEVMPVYDQLHQALTKYLEEYDYYPAALGRDKDAGIIGSLAALYPLELPEYNNQKMSKTLKIIHDDYFFQGGFFQENIHSGVNPYLTIQVAQGFLMQGRSNTAFSILEMLVKWAQKGYTFPEAVHPKTRGGCMGDGFHGWAFAETVSIFHNMFYLELSQGALLLSGVPIEWFHTGFSVVNLNTSLGCLTISAKQNHVEITGLANYNDFYIQIPKSRTIKLIAGFVLKPKAVSHISLGRSKAAEGSVYLLHPQGPLLKFSLQ